VSKLVVITGYTHIYSHISAALIYSSAAGLG